MEFKDRIFWARTREELTLMEPGQKEVTQKELARRVRQLPGGENFTQQSLSYLEGGKHSSTGYIVQIAIVTGTCPEWLAMGTGPRTTEEAAREHVDISELSSGDQAAVKTLTDSLKKPKAHNM